MNVPSGIGKLLLCALHCVLNCFMNFLCSNKFTTSSVMTLYVHHCSLYVVNITQHFLSHPLMMEVVQEEEVLL